MNALSELQPSAMLSSEARHYLENALSESTRRAYKSDLEHYAAWAGTIPASPELIVAYITTHAATLSMATLQRRLVSLSKAHTMQGYADPVRTDMVRLTFRGIRREHAKGQRQAAALLREDLFTILRQMPDTKKGARDKALLVIGFAAGLRRSEIVGLDIADIAFVSQGMTIHLRKSKTDALREGRTIAVPFGRTSICPVRMVTEWMVALGEPQGPLFRPISKGGHISCQRLSEHAISALVKHYAGKIGLDAQAFSAHSIRAGLVSSCAMAGVASWIIKRTTGHRSEEMVQRYIRPVEDFSYNAAGFLF